MESTKGRGNVCKREKSRNAGGSEEVYLSVGEDGDENQLCKAAGCDS